MPSQNQQNLNDDLNRLASLRKNLEKRAHILRSIRKFFDSRGSLEVETPSRVRTPGTDLNLSPFSTEEKFLITSPEFHMKRLMGAGYQRIHQICHCFRADELGDHHNSEFTMLEWYWAGATYLELASELEEMIADVAKELSGSAQIGDVDLAPPWQRMTVEEAFERFAHWRPGPAPDPDRFFRDLVEKIEPNLGKSRPTILYEYPASQAILSRLNPKNPEVALRFELYIKGIELANAFDELIDPLEQRERFEKENRKRSDLGKPTLPIDERLLDSLDSMGQTSGAALGIDRLVMLLVGAHSIAEVISFPEHWV